MARKKKNVDPGPVRMDLTPLIDCVFLLIVFFIVAGKFKKIEKRIDAFLPKDFGIDTRSRPKDPDKFFISVICMGNRDKVYWRVNDQKVETMSQLVAKLKELAKATGTDDYHNIKVTVDGQATVNFYWVIAVLDACAAANLPEIIFAPPRVPLAQWPHPRPKNIPLPAN